MPKIISDTIIVRNKGAVILPSQIRERLGMKVGTRLTVRIDSNQNVVLEKQADRLDKWIGILKDDKTTKETLEEMTKEDRDHV